MDVLFLSGSAEIGGAERSLLDILSSLRLARPAWHLRLLTPGEGPLVHDARALGVTADPLPFGSALARLGEPAAGADLVHLLARAARTAGPVARYAGRLRARLRASAPDIVHTHGLKAHFLAAWANPGAARVIWHLHDYVGRRRTSAALLRRSVHRCAGVLANSQSVADDARATLGVGVSVAAVLNGVDLTRYTPEGPRIDLDAADRRPESGDRRDGLAAKSGTLRVGLLGTFGRWKGHATFLEACARLSPDLRIHAYIIGAPLYTTDGSQYTVEELKGLAASLGLAGRVTFTGYVAQSDRALRALDIVVHASTDPEPFGLVIAEAMACGRPVIVADAGGAREIVQPGVDAVTHRPGDAASLAARISELAADPACRVRLAHAARVSAEHRFDRTRLAGELTPIYERVLATGAVA